MFYYIPEIMDLPEKIVFLLMAFATLELRNIRFFEIILSIL